jgi:hypothetical protein
MTTTITNRTIPSFRTHSRLGATLRALCIVTICAALTASFLAQVWRSPQPGGDATHAATPATAERAS